MTARAVRSIVLGICAVGIAGMVVGSVAGNDGTALVFGLVTAAAVACLIVATAVARPVGGPPDEEQARLVEHRVQALVEAGADEAQVRELVREAAKLGTSGASSPSGRKGEAGAGVHGGRTPRPGGRTFT